MKRNYSLIFFSLILVIYVVFPRLVLASTVEDALGAAKESSTPSMQPTNEGPGLILPDNPLFILDQFKQSIRLALAITPEAKTKTYTAIAGERLAELRYMIARNNEKGMEIALSGMSDNLKMAASTISQSQFSGNDVSETALNLNINIKEKQQILDNLEKQSKGELKSQITIAQEKVLSAKLIVENILPIHEREKELTEDLERNINKEIANIKSSTENIERNISVLSSVSKKAVAGASTSATETEDGKK